MAINPLRPATRGYVSLADYADSVALVLGAFKQHHLASALGSERDRPFTRTRMEGRASEEAAEALSASDSREEDARGAAKAPSSFFLEYPPDLCAIGAF